MIKKHFSTDELFVFHYRIKFEEELNNEEDFALQSECFSNAYQSYYKMIYKIKGDFSVINGAEILSLDDNCLCFAPPHKSLYLKQNEKGFFDYICIAFMPTIFKNEFNYKEVLLPFDKLPDNQRVADVKKYKNCDGLQAFASLKYAINKSYSYFHVVSHVKFILSQLYFECNKHFNDGLAISDNISVNVMHYITNHFAEPLTLSFLEEKFDISASTINKIVKNMSSFTFLEYITGLRLKKAEELLATSNLSAEKIAFISGFNHYSTFYRAYKKKYGITPKDDLKYFKEHKEFYRKP